MAGDSGQVPRRPSTGPQPGQPGRPGTGGGVADGGDPGDDVPGVGGIPFPETEDEATGDEGNDADATGRDDQARADAATGNGRPRDGSGHGRPAEAPGETASKSSELIPSAARPNDLNNNLQFPEMLDPYTPPETEAEWHAFNRLPRAGVHTQAFYDQDLAGQPIYQPRLSGDKMHRRVSNGVTFLTIPEVSIHGRRRSHRDDTECPRPATWAR